MDQKLLIVLLCMNMVCSALTLLVLLRANPIAATPMSKAVFAPHKLVLLGDLMDRLSIINTKIYHRVEVLQNPAGRSDTEVALAAKEAQFLNTQRVDLKNRIDFLYGVNIEELEIKSVMNVYVFKDKEGNEIGRTTNQIEAQAFQSAYPDYVMSSDITQDGAAVNTLPTLTQ